MKKIIYLLISTGLFIGCVDSLDDYNVDPKRADLVTPETLYTSAIKSLADVLTSSDVNVNNFRLYVQHWTTTTYLDEPRYVLTSRAIPQNFWDRLYRDVIADLVEAKRILDANELINPDLKRNQRAQLEIIEIYAWSILVNTFGNVPYREAMDPFNVLPEYDDAETIYKDLLGRLDDAIEMLNTRAAGFGNGELMYASKAADMRIGHWRRLGNSIKLKMGMVLADIDPATAGRIVAEAAPNVFLSSADNARFPYISDPPNNNPIASSLNPSFTTREDFLPANTIVDVMNELNDPRREFYFTKIDDQFKGGVYGFGNEYADFSKVHPAITAPDFEALILDFPEVRFLLAEAIERGFISGDAEQEYNSAVAASIRYWGGTEADALSYLEQPSVKYSGGGATWKEKVGTQKWIALYNRGWDAWLEWRRLDYPLLQPPSGPNIPTQLNIPARIIYPINEQTINGANRSAAATAIGGDEATTKLFWDID